MTDMRSTDVTVAELMTRSPVVVSEDDTITAVADLLAGFEITGLPVVDRDGRVVGVISQTDLVRLRGSTPWRGWRGLLVRDLMSKPAKTVPESATIGEVAEQLTSEHVHRLVVVDRLGEPIGIVSGGDLIREIVEADED
jgi:CBS domain-containing protein